MTPLPLDTFLLVHSHLGIDGISDLDRTEFSREPDAANVPLPASFCVGGSGFVYLNLSNIGNVWLQHAGLNTATNLG